MKTTTLNFPYAARRVYPACMAALRGSGAFRSIHGDERTFRIIDSCRVEIKSTDKLIFNPLKFGLASGK